MFRRWSGLVMVFLLAALAGCSGDKGGASANPAGNPVSTFILSGTISGLSGSLRVSNNDGQNLNLVTGDTTFSLVVTANTAYSLSVSNQPVNQICTLNNASGTASANISNIQISCITSTYTLGGSITGLTGNLAIHNTDGQDLLIPAGTGSFSLAVANGSSYNLSVTSQPLNQICIIVNGSGTANAPVSNINIACFVSTYTLGGTVSGLTGNLIIHNSDGQNLLIPAGTTGFSLAVVNGSNYNLSAISQPLNQLCNISNASGIAIASVSNINISCVTTHYALSGSVSGLSGFLTLHNSDGQDLVLPPGSSTFSMAVTNGSNYNLSVTGQPVNQNCVISNASGTATGNIGNVSINCSNTHYSIGGSISGLGGNLTLHNSDGQDVFVPSGSSYNLAVLAGSNYSLTVSGQPLNQNCVISNASGTANTNLSNINISCTIVSYSIGGSISGLGGNLTLHNSDGQDVFVPSGSSSYNLAVSAGSNYSLTVSSHPLNQTCVISNASGTANTTVSNINISCSNNGPYTISGSVSGLSGILSLQNNGTDTLNINSNGSFSFSTPVFSYNVTIVYAPNSQACTVSNGAGTATTNVSNVTIICSNNTTDPLFSSQWHLSNSVQTGEDLNISNTWDTSCGNVSCRGNNVRVVVVDDGLDYNHEDLQPNFNGNSWSYLTNTSLPAHSGTDAHGTAVAGIIAARDWNGLGGRGVAPRADLDAYNLLANSTTVTMPAALTRDVVNVDVFNNSWGPADNTGTHSAAPGVWYSAIDTGLSTGRSGLGSIYIWAAGNGAPDDNSNQDGYANYRGVMAIGAVQDDGTYASYSERGANLWLSAPAGDFCDSSRSIVTTDRSAADGYNDNGFNIYYGNIDLANSHYTQCFNGTSAATPMVSGVVALILQANPALGWRDVRLILAETARQTDAGNNADGIGWQTGALIPGSSTTHYLYHHQYGFGVVDATAAVARARTWTNVSGAVSDSDCTATRSAVNLAIAEFPGAGTTDTLTISNCGIAKIEFVEILFNSDHSYASDLDIELISPTGVTSLLAENTICAGSCASYSNWTFGSAVHLGENANGTWTLRVTDRNTGDTGQINDWRLTFHGRAN